MSHLTDDPCRRGYDKLGALGADEAAPGLALVRDLALHDEGSRGSRGSRRSRRSRPGAAPTAGTVVGAASGRDGAGVGAAKPWLLGRS